MTATAEAVALANGLTVVEVLPLPLLNQGFAVFEIVDGIGVLAKAAAVAADPNVTGAQPDFVYDTSQGGAQRGPQIAYAPGMIGADLAQTVSRGEGVRVAVIDAGIDNGNLRLQQRVTEYSDVTGTGWTPDVHGTLVAGLIAADAGQGGAPSGIAPGASLVAVKACVAQSPTQAAARCWSSTLARGIDVASRKNVRVMNLSVGGQQDQLLAKMVDAASAKGIAVISAAGNDGASGKPSYPAAMDSVIAITAVDAAGRLYPRATQGSFIDLAAPGVDILSTGPGGRDQLFSGTSAATAFASGAVALLLQRSNLSVSDLRALLQRTAKDLGTGGKDTEFGDGLLDVCRAVAESSGRKLDCR
jgi:subtilisin family serine protease